VRYQSDKSSDIINGATISMLGLKFGVYWKLISQVEDIPGPTARRI
jgi:hypothetical protein